MDYESQKSMYDMFLLNEAYEQEKMNLFIQEAILWASGEMTPEKLQIIEEGVKDKIKEKISSAWEFAKKVVRTVVNRVSNFVKSEKSFLEDNKDIIIGKKVKYQEDFSLYPYTEGIKRMSEYKIPPFEYEKLNNKIPDPEAAEKDFSNGVLKAYFDFTAFESSKDDLLDKAKDYFRGGPEKTYTAEQLNMTDMYNTCYDYKEKIEPSFKSDLDIIESTKEKMISALSKIKLNESVLFYDGPITMYSPFLESYVVFNEANPPDPDDPTTKVDSTDNLTGKTNKEQVNKAGDQIKNTKMQKGDNNLGTDNLEKDINGDKELADKFQRRCDLYTDTARIITQAKISVAEEMYKKYKEIIEKHVKSYGGQAKDDTEGDKPKSGASDFNNNLTDDAKRALDNQKGVTDVKICRTSQNVGNTDVNGYIIRIFMTDENGQNQIIDQDVEHFYPGTKDPTNLPFVPGSVSVSKDKNGIWGIFRTYKDNNNGGKEKKMVSYINTKKAPLKDSGFDEKLDTKTTLKTK